ncbi:MAG: peptide/nickel transport system substrate-binding protein [Thermomicrobiales bacterium]|jgi:peptide/nickel transport system substrate-binding protein|nr:peptide/nickel transport system substrate-binding protein [Thermomicrobiales bacterium]
MDPRRDVDLSAIVGRRVNRRRLVTGSAALAVTPWASRLPTVRAQDGGQELHVGLDGEPTNLDATSPSEDLVEYASSQQVFDSLLTYSYDGQMTVQPNLIETWSWTDPQTFAFKLRAGVKFHNGREMTADDVKFTIEYIKDPANGSRIASYVDPVDRVDVVDALNGTIHLKYPFAPLETYVLQKIYVVPQEAMETIKTEPVGSGPFRYQEWKKGESLTLVKNPDYWQTGKPLVDRLVFQFFPQYQTQVSSFKSGDTDLILWLSNADADPFKAMKDVRIEEMGLFGNFYIHINVTRDPWTNLKLREAIKYGVDKQLVLNTSQLGYGTTVDINELPESPYYTADFNYTRDVERAKALIADSGVSDITDDLVIPNTPTEGPIGEAVAFSLSELGMNIKPLKLDVPQYIERAFVDRDYGIGIVGYSGVPDPDFYDYPYLHTSGSTNIFNYSNAEMDAALEKGRSSTSLEDRKAAYYTVIQRMAEDIPMVWLINEYRFTAIKSNVQGFKWNRSKIYNYLDATKA